MDRNGFGLTRDLALLLLGNLIKRGLREIKVVHVFARRAGIGDGHNDRLAVVGVGEPDLPAAVGRNSVDTSVERGLCQMISINITY